jgi:hypothetical protein
MKKHLLIFVVFLCSAMSMFSHAQTSQGILVGVVRDSSGAVVPNAAVTIKGSSDGFTRTVNTKADGAYRIESLSPEPYTVSLAQPGFEGYVARDVIVTASQVTSYDVVLKVGSANESVSVQADSIGINTDNGQLTGIINATDLNKLPIFSLSPYELTITVPGAQAVSASGFSNGIERRSPSCE